MDEVGTNGYSYMYQWFSGSGNRAAVLSDKLMSVFNEPDMQGDLRKAYTVKDYQNGNELRKYMAGDISNSLNKTCEVAYPIYRYTDMLLLQAEARARLGKWEEALDLVKKCVIVPGWLLLLHLALHRKMKSLIIYCVNVR